MEALELFRWSLRYVHITGGAIGLILFWGPVLSPRESRLHIGSGRAFVAIAQRRENSGLS